MSTPADQLGTPPAPAPGAALPPGGPANAPAPPPPMGAGGEPAPGGAPTMAPQAAKGDEASADARIQIAMRILEEAISKYGYKSDKGKAVLWMIQAGARAFGRNEDQAQAILPAELKNALIGDGAAGAGGGPPPGPGGPGAGAPPPQAPGGIPPGGSPMT